MAGPRAHRRARGQSWQLLRAGQRLPGDEAHGPDSARAQDQHHPGGGRQPALPLVLRLQPRDEAGEGRDARHGHPHRQSRQAGSKAARVIEEMGGWCEQVSEQEIALAKAEIGAEGVGCEPASAVTLAGLKKLVAQGRVSPGERVVLVLTGHTLKDPQYTIDYHRGELLTPVELAGATPAERTQHDALRKPPIVLEADEAVVLRALEEQMAISDAAHAPVASGIPV